MNRIAARLLTLEHENGVTLIEAEAQGQVFSAMLVGDKPDLAPGAPVTLAFKETEVAIARNLGGEISLRNRIAATVISLEDGSLLTRVRFDFAGQPIHAVITTGSARRLDLAAGVAVEWLVKANEMGIEC
ncbi:TOBE domain-containing protein [Silvimonas iriomotensis]|uniref:Mop domain-containing protein n=1 Tax=Silvimonas iriomotensis TaxID=449662 RepID=A0ABQ2P842_9NEIS|nr:TOBE domain-containing protein [Silvimonas iriomotensis]GGP20570.1 hypothetical protein GCM10010970_15870 [Silvimonas iriomotensis]